MNFPPPLRIGIPALIGALGIGFVVCEYSVLLGLNRERATQDAVKLAEDEAARLAGLAMRDIDQSGPEKLKMEFRFLVEDPDVKYAVVCNNKNHIVAAARAEWFMRPITSTAAVDGMDIMKVARKTREPRSRVLEGRDLVVAVHPVVGESAEAPNVVMVERDVSNLDDLAHRITLRDTRVTALVTVPFAMLLWAALSIWVKGRADLTLTAASDLLDKSMPPRLMRGGDEFARINSTLHSVHQRVTVQARTVQEQDDRLRRLLETLPLLVFVTRDDRIEFVNEAGLRLLAANTADQVLGRSPFDIIHPGSHQAARDQFRLALRYGANAQIMEQTVLRLDGTEVDVEAVVSPFRDERGVATQTVMRDITEDKALQASRVALSRDLEEKNKELEAIVYAASHDLRSPLLNVMGFSRQLGTACRQMETLISNGGSSPHPVDSAPLEPIVKRTVPRALRFIEQGVTKMDSLLTGFLRFSRVGRQEKDVQLLDMDAMMKSISGAMTFQLQQAGAEFRPSPLPPCRGDAMQISQVFTNLIDNALKYRKPDVPCVISVQGLVQGGHVVYTVSDNGIGIAPEHQQKIFEIFHRLNPNGTTGEGLGLTIAQRIVQRHDGILSVESKAGVGTTFTVTLPASP